MMATDLVGPPRNVVILATPVVSSLEVAGCAEAFHMAETKLKEAGRVHGRPYRVHVVSSLPGQTDLPGSGVAIKAQCSFDAFIGAVDTFLVAGGLEVWTGGDHKALQEWVRKTAAGSRRFGSICSGAFVLAQAGLLDGHRVTTHWYFCDRLARQYPRVTVDPEPIFVQQGRLWTAAGVAAGIDMALAMVEDDLGVDIALQVARALVLYVRRPAWQSQFSSPLAMQGTKHVRFRDLPFWILDHLSANPCRPIGWRSAPR